MTDNKPKTPEELNREKMAEALVELETQALIERMNAGNDPMTPVEGPAPEDDTGPEHVGRSEVPPNEVIDEEGLGRK